MASKVISKSQFQHAVSSLVQELTTMPDDLWESLDIKAEIKFPNGQTVFVGIEETEPAEDK